MSNMPGQSRIRLQESRNINALPYRRTTNNSCQLQPANQLDSFLAQQLAQTDQKKRRKTISLESKQELIRNWIRFPILYDKYYASSRITRMEAFEQLRENTSFSMYQLRSLLNNLKRRYKLELIKAEQGRVSDWVLYNAMHFLKPYIRIGQSSTASTAYQDTFNIGEDEEDDEEPNSPIANASTSGERVKCSPEPQSFDVKDFQLTVPCDREQMMGNYVAMHMRDLPPERAMEVSVEIIKVLSTFMKYRIHK